MMGQQFTQYLQLIQVLVWNVLMDVQCVRIQFVMSVRRESTSMMMVLFKNVTLTCNANRWKDSMLLKITRHVFLAMVEVSVSNA